MHDLPTIRDRIAGWLLAHAVVPTGQPHAGAAVTWREADGRWNAAYPEISGYFLTFLSMLDAPRAGTSDLARRVVTWLWNVARDAPPLTRYYASGSVDDWRNAAVFSFDLSMVLRGLVNTARAFPSLRIDAATDRYGEILLSVQEGGILASHQLHPAGKTALPDKWSTRPGFHHVKAAAALGLWHGPQSHALARETVDAWRARLPAVMDGFRAEFAHAYLYGIEGLLIEWARSGDASLLAHAREAFGPILAIPAVTFGRSDVVAQVIRVGTILDKCGHLGGVWERRRDELLIILLAQVEDDGGVLFAPGSQHRNVWAGMFAHQALTMAAVPSEPRQMARTII